MRENRLTKKTFPCQMLSWREEPEQRQCSRESQVGRKALCTGPGQDSYQQQRLYPHK